MLSELPLSGALMDLCIRAFLMLMLFVQVAAAQPAENPSTEAGHVSELQARLDAMAKPAGRTIKGARIAGYEFLPRFYEALGGQLAWSNKANVDALKSGIKRSWEDGLIAADFHDKFVSEFETHASDAAEAANADLILSDALARLLYQLYFGKVSPNGVEATWNFARPMLTDDPVKIISDAVRAGGVGELIEKAKLDHAFYKSLKATLQAYTQIEQSGGWPQITAGAPVKVGAKDARIPVIRKRLAITGEYQGSDLTSDTLDEPLSEALKKFQANHGIDPVGTVGNQTLAALNVPVKERIEQIRVNLERARWVLRTIGSDMVVVNIAGFYLRLVFDSKVAWGTRVIVGKPYTKTPVFTGDMSTIVLNPDWAVPKSIVRNEMFPKIIADPSYIKANNYTLTSAKGQVNPSSVDWSEVSTDTFPYGMVQMPGPNNALGRVKFLFPNKYSVYLHDTPGRTLFDKAGRDFSHGCIRVEDPLKLAELILSNRLGWTRAKIDGIVDSGKTVQVNLPKALPVLLLYWTVDPQGDGGAKFYSDIYTRDAKLLKALDSEFKPALQ